MNSVNEAMYHGVPMLVMPIIYDQPINAEQVVRLNLGRKLHMFPLRAKTLFQEAMSVLDNQGIKEECKKMKEELRAGGSSPD